MEQKSSILTSVLKNSSDELFDSDIINTKQRNAIKIHVKLSRNGLFYGRLLVTPLIGTKINILSVSAQAEAMKLRILIAFQVPSS